MCPKWLKSQPGIKFITNQSVLDDHGQKLRLPTDILTMSIDRHF